MLLNSILRLPERMYDLFWSLRRESRDRRTQRAAQYLAAPKRISGRRSLTDPNVSNKSNTTRLNDQTQSPFFSKLPLEIRLQIYVLVLNQKRVIHLKVWKKILWHCVCTQRRGCPNHYEYVSPHPCWTNPRLKSERELFWPSTKPQRKICNISTSDRLLSLPISSRRA